MPVMATIHSTSDWKIKIYADDHAPPHFHVQTPDGESLVAIAGLTVLGHGANAKALKAALAWARQNIHLLMQAWNTQNRRN